MSYYGWDGDDHTEAALGYQYQVLDMVGGPELWQVLVDKNNSGESYEMMADWLTVTTGAADRVMLNVLPTPNYRGPKRFLSNKNGYIKRSSPKWPESI